MRYKLQTPHKKTQSITLVKDWASKEPLKHKKSPNTAAWTSNESLRKYYSCLSHLSICSLGL